MTPTKQQIAAKIREYQVEAGVTLSEEEAIVQIDLDTEELKRWEDANNEGLY